MADKPKPKFIPAETQYGFGENKRIRVPADRRILPGSKESEEVSKVVREIEAAQLGHTIRMGERLTRDDKNELAKLRQQMERGGTGVEAGPAERDLEEQAEDARREADMAYGDAEVAQRAREAEERLADFRSKHSGAVDAGKTMIVEPLPFPKKKGFFTKLFGK